MIMSLFQDRERAAERKFEQEQERAFLILARRNKLLGMWAAGHMGLIGDAAAHYAMNLVEAYVGEHNENALIKKVCSDLLARGFPISEGDVRHRLTVFAGVARTQIARAAGVSG
jgi:hypothetical protein